MNSRRGFSIIEVLLVIFVVSILFAMSLSALRLFSGATDLTEASDGVVVALGEARQKTINSEDASPYGVYFATETNPHQYVLFKGASYAERDEDADIVYKLPAAVEFSLVSLGGEDEVVFSRLTGQSAQSGLVTLNVKTNSDETRTVYVDSSGQVSMTPFPAASDDDRITDSRHVHVDYSRFVTTATESITLTFDGGTASQVIPIASNLDGGELSWTGTVTVGGADQVVTLRTHRLNNPDTQFSIHRDLRYNTKSLVITVSGDATGNIVSYSANGATVINTSIHAQDPDLQ